MTAVVTGPIQITTEGIHDLKFHSIDRSQNVEPSKETIVRIDKTAPEAVIIYEPHSHQIVVTGRDALSGVNPGPIGPVSVTPWTWTDFGSDVAESRTYHITDHADNSLVLTMKVKCEPDEFEVSVTDLNYNDGKSHRPQRNTIEFERLIGRSSDHPLLAVEQEVSFGESDTRSTVEATYDVLHDESEIEDKFGYFTCDTISGGQKYKEQQNDGQDDQKNDAEQRGLSLLRIVTDKGLLKLEK